MITVKVKNFGELKKTGVFFIAGLVVPAALMFIDEGNYSLSVQQVFSIDFLVAFIWTGIPCVGAMILINDYLSRRMNSSRAFVVSVIGGILSGCLFLAGIFTTVFYLIKLIH